MPKVTPEKMEVTWGEGGTEGWRDGGVEGIGEGLVVMEIGKGGVRRAQECDGAWRRERSGDNRRRERERERERETGGRKGRRKITLTETRWTC